MEQTRRLESAEIRLLRPPADYSLLDHQTNEHVHNKVRINNITTILDTHRNNIILYPSSKPCLCNKGYDLSNFQVPNFLLSSFPCCHSPKIHLYSQYIFTWCLPNVQVSAPYNMLFCNSNLYMSVLVFLQYFLLHKT